MLRFSSTLLSFTVSSQLEVFAYHFQLGLACYSVRFAFVDRMCFAKNIAKTVKMLSVEFGGLMVDLLPQ